MGLPFTIAAVVDLASKRHSKPPAVSFPPGGGTGGDMSSLAPGLLLFGGVLLVALMAYLAYAMQRRRREGFRQVAARCGLRYSRDDPLGLLGYPFTLFSRGD